MPQFEQDWLELGAARSACSLHYQHPGNLRLLEAARAEPISAYAPSTQLCYVVDTCSECHVVREGRTLMTRRMRRTVVVIATLMAMASTVLGAAPAYAAVDDVAVRDWLHLRRLAGAWRQHLHRAVPGKHPPTTPTPGTTPRLAYQHPPHGQRHPRHLQPLRLHGARRPDEHRRPAPLPVGPCSSTKQNHKGEWDQGQFHDTTNAQVVPEFFILTHGELSVHWTAPNKAAPSTRSAPTPSTRRAHT